MSSKEIAIKVENLSKKYEIGKQKDGSLRGTLANLFKSGNSSTEEFNALTELNFEINKGDVVGVIGKNGAGKSTLLKVLSQITKPSNGRIEINGRVASLLEVGTGFHPELTGRENIFLNGTILGMTRKEVKTKFDEIVEFSGVQKFIDTPVKHYSSGMYVRLAFAVAAHLEPEILIIDEVLAVGDAEFQKKCLGKMKDVARQGRTVLFVSHTMGAIQSLCNRCILLEKGKIVYKGDTNTCINRYLSANRNDELSGLLEVEKRSGNGKLRFSDLRLQNNNNEFITEAISGAPLKLIIDFKLYDRVNLKKLILAINFRDVYENAVIGFVTDEMGITFSNDSVSNQIEISIPKLMLRGGKYYLRLLASEGDTYKENFLDEVDHAYTLNVISSDYWQSGKTLREGTIAFSDANIRIL